MNKIRIAIDGPSASGKSSAAERLAERLGYFRVEGGSFYRAITHLILEKYGDEYNLENDDVKQFVEGTKIEIRNRELFSNGRSLMKYLRTSRIDENVGLVAKVKYIRTIVHKIERELVESCDCGLVMDGRDIGTVVMPDAFIKFFITASAEERASRRTMQDKSLNYKDVLENLKKRDYEDTHREHDPLIQAEDAILINNEHLNLEQTVQLMNNMFTDKMTSSYELP
ncbi:putative cytidylate kinase [Enterospora canceri]|uniref:(d)CMP kinase n=1 Tax=Enterospora canceri TaxID=1081671 RepID=A0A1Y1S9K6_9MICR|nr:putative cytidylate kinase [Enterospora canceri]